MADDHGAPRVKCSTDFLDKNQPCVLECRADGDLATTPSRLSRRVVVFIMPAIAVHSEVWIDLSLQLYPSEQRWRCGTIVVDRHDGDTRVERTRDNRTVWLTDGVP